MPEMNQKKSRSQLKAALASFDGPAAAVFNELIESTVNQVDDGIFKREADLFAQPRAAGQAAAPVTIDAAVTVTGALYCGASELHFTNDGHESSLPTSGILGLAAIENVSSIEALLISGRLRNDVQRYIRLTDNAEVTGSLAADSLSIGGAPNPGPNSAAVANTLSVGGSLHAKAGLDVAGTLEANGAARLNAGLAAKGGAQIEGNVSLANALSVGGALQAKGSLDVAGSLDTKGAARMNGGLNVKGGAHVEGNGGVLRIHGSDHAYIEWYPIAGQGRKGWLGYGGQNSTTLSLSSEAGMLDLVPAAGNAIRAQGRLQVRERLQLGDKWLLSGVGDAHGNDDWLRLFNTSGTDYYGGLAANKLWTTDLSVVGAANITSGAKIFEIGIGTQHHGATTWPYETIQMNPGHNLRLWYGSTERVVFGNDGSLLLRFNNGYWAFQADGNLVKYRNNGQPLWALNKVSGHWQW